LNKLARYSDWSFSSRIARAGPGPAGFNSGNHFFKKIAGQGCWFASTTAGGLAFTVAVAFSIPRLEFSPPKHSGGVRSVGPPEW